MIKRLVEAMSGKRVLGFDGKDEIGDFFVVTDPSRMQEADLVDILFKADVFDMMLQKDGGLKPSDVIGLYKTEKKARRVAEKLLDLDRKKKKLKEAKKGSKGASKYMQKELDMLEDKIDDFMMHTEMTKDEASLPRHRRLNPKRVPPEQDMTEMKKSWIQLDRAADAFKARAKAFIRTVKIMTENENEAVKSSGIPSFKSLFEAKGTKIKTSKDDGHTHEGLVDDEGDGKTTKTIGGKDHVHKIVGGSVEKAAGHDHTIK